MKKTKRLFRAVILTAAIVAFLLTGCKPKEMIHVRTVTKVDSSAVMRLQEQLSERTKEVETLRIDLQRTREDNSRLREEINKHEVEYDTSVPIVPETGKPPVKKETTTSSKRILENKIKDFENAKVEDEQLIEELTTKNENLEYRVDLLLKENEEIKAKILPRAGFNFKVGFWVFLVGIFTGILGYVFLGKKVSNRLKLLKILKK